MIVFKIIVLFSLCNNITGAKILALFAMPSPSHQILVEPFLRALTRRGHQVTMVSPFPSGKTTENYTEVYFDQMLEYKESKCNNFKFIAICSLMRIRKPKIESQWRRVVNICGRTVSRCW